MWGEVIINLQYVYKIEPPGGLDMGCNKMRIGWLPRISGLNNSKDDVPIYWDDEDCEGSDFWGKEEFGFGFGLVKFEMPKSSHETRWTH